MSVLRDFIEFSNWMIFWACLISLVYSFITEILSQLEHELQGPKVICLRRIRMVLIRNDKAQHNPCPDSGNMWCVWLPLSCSQASLAWQEQPAPHSQSPIVSFSGSARARNIKLYWCVWYRLSDLFVWQVLQLWGLSSSCVQFWEIYIYSLDE